MVIIILAFVPVFALTGMEGKMFHPLAFTKTFAMVSSTILAITLVPVLCTFLIRGKLHREEDNPADAASPRYLPARAALGTAPPDGNLAVAVLLFAAALYTATTIGSEFMPPLDEETALFMPITDPRISLTEGHGDHRQQDRIIAADPAVEMVVGKIGRAETATDPAPINMAETTVVFKPKDQWPAGTTKDSIIQRLDAKLHIPGVSNIWTQPIRNRIDMLSTGIRTQVGVKVFGPTCSVIEQKSEEIERVLRQVPGAVDLYAERITGAPYLEINVNREAAARYGINVADAQDVIEAAIGGKILTTTIEGRQRFPVRVRYARDFRQDIDELKNVLVTGNTGTQVPLQEVSTIQMVMGPSMISSENGLLRGTVLMNVRGRDVGGFVDEASSAVARNVSMPQGYYVQWSGQFENQISAKKTARIGDSGRAADHLRTALSYVQLMEGSCPRTTRGALRSHWRRLPREAPRLQLLRCRLGRLHRPVRHRRPNRRCNGHLSGRSRGSSHRHGWHPHARRPPCSGNGRGPPAPSPQSDDRGNRCRWPSPSDVVNANRRGVHEAAGRTGARRHGQFTFTRSDSDARHLHMVERAGAAQDEQRA